MFYIGLCRQARNGTFVRNHLVCSEFYQCIDEEPIRRSCPEGLWYNHMQQRCDIYFLVTCQLDDLVCDEIEAGSRIRSPVSCSDFVLCSHGGIPFPLRCEPEWFFDERLGSCAPEDEVDCDLNVPTEPPRNACDRQLDFSLAGSTDNCRTYFVCYNNEILFELECSEDQVFDPETQVCGEEFICPL